MSVILEPVCVETKIIFSASGIIDLYQVFVELTTVIACSASPIRCVATECWIKVIVQVGVNSIRLGLLWIYCAWCHCDRRDHVDSSFVDETSKEHVL